MIGHIQSTLSGIRLTQLINRILAHTHSLGKNNRKNSLVWRIGIQRTVANTTAHRTTNHYGYNKALNLYKGCTALENYMVLELRLVQEKSLEKLSFLEIKIENFIKSRPLFIHTKKLKDLLDITRNICYL